MIGIIGGMGPHAGALLAKRIFDQTDARRDQEHLPVALLSMPGLIADRTGFLTRGEGANPSEGIIQVMDRLLDLGATVLGMPCNTAHSSRILDPVLDHLSRRAPGLRFVHMIDETIAHIRDALPQVRRVGVLATLGTYETGLYRDALERAGLEAVRPDPALRTDLIHRALYDPDFGIKVHPDQIGPEPVQRLSDAVAHLAERGAACAILGCTELPLALPPGSNVALPLVDSVDCLARSLIRALDPSRLKPTS